MNRCENNLKSLNCICFAVVCMVGRVTRRATITIHLLEQLLFQDVNCKLFFLAGVNDLVCQNRELIEQLVGTSSARIVTIALILLSWGGLPSDDLL